MYKNRAGQKLVVYAYTVFTTTHVPVGTPNDQDNITAYISKDGGAPAALNDVHPIQLDGTNMPGVYVFDLTQAETDADMIVVKAKSSTSSYIVIEPVVIYPLPENFADAVKQTVNKVAYDKSTGVMTVYDDDGVTALFTQTMTEAGTVETRTRADV